MRLAHVIIKSPIGYRLDKAGMRNKNVEILGASDTQYYCECGYFELLRRSDDQSDPVRHRFSIALFALQECAPYAFCKLSEVEEEAKRQLLLFVKKITEEMRGRK